MPKTWTTQEKKKVYWVARARPGAHSLENGMPLVLILREMLKYAETARESKHILNHKNVMIDGVRRKDHRFIVGLMDVISITELKEHYRVSINKYGKLQLIKADEKEANSKICKIKGKGLHNGKTQLRLSDGRTLLVEKGAYKTGDSVVISVPDQKITKHLAFEKGAEVLLTKGKKIGTTGKIHDIKPASENHEAVVVIKTGSETFETLKNYCLVIGKEKSTFKLE